MPGNSDSFMARVRKLFWIAASNFVIPGKIIGTSLLEDTDHILVCFDFVLLTIPYTSAAAIYAQLANLYVNLIGVVFATGIQGLTCIVHTSRPHSQFL
jgi:hypothetical protein